MKAQAEGTILPSETPPTPLSNWQPSPGDMVIIDTKYNVGYLTHPNGAYVEFPVATGQRRVVRYIGRVYAAATPNRSWIALSREIKGDRITFGKHGIFFRLFKNDGTEETSYGIHAHAYGDRMLDQQDRYKSMGCIIVSDQVLSVIETTFDLNGNKLPVITVSGLMSDIVTFANLIHTITPENQKDL